MASIMHKLETLMNENSDPRVRNWFLMDSPFPTLAIIAVYLMVVTFILPAYMKDRKPFNLTKIMRAYNILQISSCVALIYMIISGGWYQGEYSYGCAPIDYSDNPNPVRLLSTFYWTYWLKMIELIETVFFILRKKYNQVSTLHLYHHSSTFFLAFLVCKFIGGGMSSVPVVLNSFIHILMYTYYYLSSLGPQWQKKLAVWKPKLTIAQMIQFVVLMIHSLMVFLPGCKMPKQILLIYLPNLVIIYMMFSDFYKKSYIKKAIASESIKNGIKTNGVQHSFKKSKAT